MPEMIATASEEREQPELNRRAHTATSALTASSKASPRAVSEYMTIFPRRADSASPAPRDAKRLDIGWPERRLAGLLSAKSRAA